MNTNTSLGTVDLKCSLSFHFDMQPLPKSCISSFYQNLLMYYSAGSINTNFKREIPFQNNAF